VPLPSSTAIPNFCLRTDADIGEADELVLPTPSTQRLIRDVRA
jgi:hypothetical protein